MVALLPRPSRPWLGTGRFRPSFHSTAARRRQQSASIERLDSLAGPVVTIATTGRVQQDPHFTQISLATAQGQGMITCTSFPTFFRNGDSNVPSSLFSRIHRPPPVE